MLLSLILGAIALHRSASGKEAEDIAVVLSPKGSEQAVAIIIGIVRSTLSVPNC